MKYAVMSPSTSSFVGVCIQNTIPCPAAIVPYFAKIFFKVT
jgi:hypothetical protein